MSVNMDYTLPNNLEITAPCNCTFCGCCIENEPNNSTSPVNASFQPQVSNKPSYYHEMAPPDNEYAHAQINTVVSNTSLNMTAQSGNQYTQREEHTYSRAPEANAENVSHRNASWGQFNASSNMPAYEYNYSYPSNDNNPSDCSFNAHLNNNAYPNTNNSNNNNGNNNQYATELESYEIHDNYLKAPITVTTRNVYPTIGSERLFGTSTTAATSSLLTKQDSNSTNRLNLFGCTSRNDVQVCNAFHNGRCLLSERCPDIHVNSEYLDKSRRDLTAWVTQSENNFYYTLAENPQKTFRVFVVLLKEVIDVPITYISFTRGLYVDPLTRSRRIRASGHGMGNHANAGSGQAPTNCGLYSLDPHQCKWRRWCNQVHIDPAWLRAKKRDFENWLNALSFKFANLRPDSVFMVHDPQLKVLLPIPKYAITMLTRGVFQGSSHKAPSVCLLFQRNRCTANGSCNQVHINSRYLPLTRQLYLLETNANNTTNDTHTHFKLKNEIERLRYELFEEVNHNVCELPTASNECLHHYSNAYEFNENKFNQDDYASKNEHTTNDDNNNNNNNRNNDERFVKCKQESETSNVTKVMAQTSMQRESQMSDNDFNNTTTTNSKTNTTHSDSDYNNNKLQGKKNKLLSTQNVNTFLLDMQEPCRRNSMAHYRSNTQSTHQHHNMQRYGKVTSSLPVVTHHIPVCLNREKQMNMMSFGVSTMQTSTSLDSGAIVYGNYSIENHKNVNHNNNINNNNNSKTSRESYECTQSISHENDVAKTYKDANYENRTYHNDDNDEANNSISIQYTNNNSINNNNDNNNSDSNENNNNNSGSYHHNNHLNTYQGNHHRDNGNDEEDDVCTTNTNNSITNSINSMRHVNPDGTYSNNPYGSKGSLLYPHASYEQNTVPLHLFSQHTPSAHANSLCSFSSHRAGPVRSLLAPLVESAPNIYANEQLEEEELEEEEFYYSQHLPLNTFELNSESQREQKSTYYSNLGSDKLSFNTPMNVTVSSHSHRGSVTPFAQEHHSRVRTTRVTRPSFSSFRDSQSYNNTNVCSFNSSGTSFPQTSASSALGRMQTPLLHSQQQQQQKHEQSMQ